MVITLLIIPFIWNVNNALNNVKLVQVKPSVPLVFPQQLDSLQNKIVHALMATMKLGSSNVPNVRLFV